LSVTHHAQIKSPNGTITLTSTSEQHQLVSFNHNFATIHISDFKTLWCRSN